MASKPRSCLSLIVAGQCSKNRTEDYQNSSQPAQISRLDPEADEGDPRGLIERALRYVARKAW
jgi:hypothetical protein